MSPKKRTVDRNAVKYGLSIGKYPGEIAKEWGVTRQYISSIRQELVKKGILQRGKPGRPKRSYPLWNKNDLDITDVQHFCDMTQSLILKNKSLETERDHYKLVYHYVFDKLCEHISEEEKQEVMAMTGHEYIDNSPQISLEGYEQAVKLMSKGE